MAERVQVREIDDDEGRRLLRIVRCGRSRNWTAVRSSWTVSLDALLGNLCQGSEEGRRRLQSTDHAALAAAFLPRARCARDEDGERDGRLHRALLLGTTSDVLSNYVSAYMRRGTGSVVTWRRAQMVLLSAQKMSPAKIAEVTFTSEDRVRDVIHNFNADGFDSLYPKYAGGRPRVFNLPERREIKKIAKSKPVEHGLPFSTWSLSKLADFLVAEGVVDDISHEGLRVLLREEGVSFQRMKTWKASKDPEYAVKKARVEHLYAIADGEVTPEADEPTVIWCLDEFGPLNLMPHPGRHWAAISGKNKDPDRDPRPRRRATYNRNDGVRHLFAAYNLIEDKLFGHVKPRKKRVQFLEFARYLRTLHPIETRIAIICDNYSPHLSTKKDTRVGDWAQANNVEIAYTPTNSSWLNRIEAQFTALRYFALDGTDHASHTVQASMIRRYIIWRNSHTTDPRLRKVVARANVA